MNVSKLCANQICSKPVVTTDASTNLNDVARLMREHHIGDVVVTEEGRPVGVLTDRDLVVHAMAFGLDLDSVSAGDVSTKTLVAVRPDADLLELVSAMNEHAVRRVIVLRDDEAVGIATLDDVLHTLFLIVSNLAAIAERQIERECLVEVPIAASR